MKLKMNNVQIFLDFKHVLRLIKILCNNMSVTVLEEKYLELLKG